MATEQMQKCEKAGKKVGGKPIQNPGKSTEKGTLTCSYRKSCGGCAYIGEPYERQIQEKQRKVEKLLKTFGKVEPIRGMGYPYYYRNKVQAVFGQKKNGDIVCGTYRKGTHSIVDIEDCLIQDRTATAIIRDIRDMLPSFRIHPYNEDTGYGLLRHVLIRRGYATGEVMVVLVTASPVFPSKNHFVKALLKKHPEITTVVQNINDRRTSMVLGDQEKVLWGKGFITDELLGCRFRISARSFYQVNPVQTKHLYRAAVEFAGLNGKERALDAYCGTGTIGLIAAAKAKTVLGVELNRDAVKDAITNAKHNGIKNAWFVCEDAGKFMEKAAAAGEKFDVVFMDPPRSGSSEAFLRALEKLAPERVVYISCNPETLARDLGVLKRCTGQSGFSPLTCFLSQITARYAYSCGGGNGMKNLYIVGGPMGVGKTTVCQLLKRELPRAVFLDGDWCWDMDPFQITEETKGMVMENIAFLLSRFLRCSAYENVIFCWVLHRQEIVDELLGKLDVENGAVSVRRFSLICREAELERRLRRDIDSGLRQGDVIERSLSRLPLYDKVDAVKIDVTDLSPEQTAALICGEAVEEHARVVI